MKKLIIPFNSPDIEGVFIDKDIIIHDYSSGILTHKFDRSKNTGKCISITKSNEGIEADIVINEKIIPSDIIPLLKYGLGFKTIRRDGNLIEEIDLFEISIVYP